MKLPLFLSAIVHSVALALCYALTIGSAHSTTPPSAEVSESSGSGMVASIHQGEPGLRLGRFESPAESFPQVTIADLDDELPSLGAREFPIAIAASQTSGNQPVVVGGFRPNDPSRFAGPIRINGGTGEASSGTALETASGGGGSGNGPAPTAGGNSMPDYPDLARRKGFEGMVTLTIQVSAEGRCIGVAVKKSSGHAVLDEAAIKAVDRWKFSPATRDGAPCGGSLDLEFRFKLQ